MQPLEQGGPVILSDKEYSADSVFDPKSLLREARRQKGLATEPVPPVCVLDPDGDIVRYLKREGRAKLFPNWPCYHTELYEFSLGAQRAGIIGCAVGAPFAVLVAEQLFASGCRMLLSVTSAGQLVASGRPPYFVIIDKSLRDEGVSHHYAPPDTFAGADKVLVEMAAGATAAAGLRVVVGGSWTTDAPFRETATAIEAAKLRGLLAVEMEAAALYTFATVKKVPLLCLAHVTNTMGLAGEDFEKGLDDGAAEALRLLEVIARCVASSPFFSQPRS
jgi:uridine phosphorylase